jgi:hypothetical protein
MPISTRGGKNMPKHSMHRTNTGWVCCTHDEEPAQFSYDDLKRDDDWYKCQRAVWEAIAGMEEWYQKKSREAEEARKRAEGLPRHHRREPA